SLLLAIGVALFERCLRLLAAARNTSKKNTAGAPHALGAGNWSGLGFAPMPAEEQIERARAPIPRPRRRDRKDLSSQPLLFEPSRHRKLEHPWPAGTEAPAGDDQNTAPPGVVRPVNERGEHAMRFGLGHPVQIEPCLDRVETTLQSLCVGPIDPGEAV